VLDVVAIPVSTDFAQENRFMHLASLEQQRELMRYMNSLNDWLGHDVEDRHAELQRIFDRLDQLDDDLHRSGILRCRLHYTYSPTCR
jgi:hypothetical protein